MRHVKMIAALIGVAAFALFAGCGGEDEATGDFGQVDTVKFGMDPEQRIAVYHEVENAVVKNERLGHEEHPEGGPDCIEYIDCLDDDSKAEIAKNHELTIAQLEEIVDEGHASGWSQW